MPNPADELFFEFTWTIENFSMCRRKADEQLSSPRFKVHFLRETEWFLQLYPKGLKNEKTIMCYLHRGDFGPTQIDVKYSISMEDSNCEVRQTFEKGSSSEKMVKVDRERYFKQLKGSSLEGDLRVVCRLKKGQQNAAEDPGGIRPYPVFCSARSRVPVEKRKLSWSVKNFASLPSQHEVSTSVVSASPMTPKLLVTLSWCDVTLKGGGKLKMEVREMPELVGKNFQLGCRVQMLDASDRRRQLSRGWYLFTFTQKISYLLWLKTYSDSVWNFELDVDRGDLYQRRDSLLRNGELVLECEFSISCDFLACQMEETGYVHVPQQPKLPPRDVAVQVTPTDTSWKDLGKLNNSYVSDAVLKGLGDQSIVKYISLLFMFLAVIWYFI